MKINTALVLDMTDIWQKILKEIEGFPKEIHVKKATMILELEP